MGKLRIWTSAEPRQIAASIGAALKSFRPDVPPHEFVPWSEGAELPWAEEGDVVLACGGKAVSTLQALKFVPKNRTVNSLREKVVQAGGRRLMVTFDPMVLDKEPEQAEVIGWDVRLATRLLRTGALRPVIGNYEYVGTLRPLIERIKEKYAQTGEPVRVSTDLETMTFYAYYPDRDIVSISFTVDPGIASVLYLGPQSKPAAIDPDEDLLEEIVWILSTPMVKTQGSNLKFDMIWIGEKWGVECTNFSFDTVLVGNLLNENRSNSLKMLARLKTDMGGYEDEFEAKYDKGHMELIPANDEYLTYAGGDTDADHQAAEVLRDELLEDPRLANFYVTILHPAARAFEKIERRGLCVDQQRFHVLRDDLTKVINDGRDRVLSLLPNKMRIKYRDRIDDQLAKDKSPLLPSILTEYFFSPNGLNLKPRMLTPRDQKPSHAKAHLKMFGDTPEAVAMVEAMTEMDQAEKTRSTFVDGFLKHIRPDGRLHPIYMLHHGALNDDERDESGTVGSRLACKEPAFQTVPKHTKWAKRIRECYVAPPGKKLALADYIQGELKVAACVAREKNMLVAYEKGFDLHAVTGAQLGGVSYEEFITWKKHQDEARRKLYEDLRYQAKAGNFGLLYGMGVEGFIAYAWAKYDLVLSYDEAEKIRNAFFASYPGLEKYHEKMKNIVRLHGEVRGPLGRVRHLPTAFSTYREVRAYAERQGINAPIQDTLTQMMLWATAKIEAEFGWHHDDQVAIVGNIHDASMMYVDENKVEACMGQVAEIMETLPYDELDWHPQLKFTVEAEAGYDLAHTEEVSLAGH